MNKSELVAVVAEKSGLTKKDAEKAVSAVFEAISDALVEGEKVQLVGFGTFEVRDRKERPGQIHKQNKQSSSQQLKYQLSKQVRHLKKLLLENNYLFAC